MSCNFVLKAGHAALNSRNVENGSSMGGFMLICLADTPRSILNLAIAIRCFKCLLVVLAFVFEAFLCTGS